MCELAKEIKKIDDQLSKRHIDLDPAGYFIIYLDREQKLICAKHFTNIINEQGLAVDPDTGKVIPARGKVERIAEKVYSARTSKELSVKMFEETKPCPITMFDHAAYLSREFTRAEAALVSGEEYIQD
ncbi:MAG: hypothetical protein N5P05_002021 [Chroococcopsis gigantea SAG 12.99]|jgi:dihydropteroate synthase|nr:DUF4346 domain-containing protein [Chlorogloea purpurea SAG 13.99]MDV3000415.1 hypothetical protein [Chroococcopsis gigantea SAG 12.99]